MSDATIRPVIEGIRPLVDCGRFPLKRTVGDLLAVEADVFADGHDLLAASLRCRRPGVEEWSEEPMLHLGNDHWRGRVPLDHLGLHSCVIVAWIDRFHTWLRDLNVKVAAGQDPASDLLVGAELAREAAGRAGDGRLALAQWADRLAGAGEDALEGAVDPEFERLMERSADRSAAATSQVIEVLVERPRAASGAWYELFPRSWSPHPGRHGTLVDVRHSLPYIADMGFDVLYLPPIHPIGTTDRKGPGNVLAATSAAPGSPWAIGSPAGGHTAIHPDLGTMQDFEALVAAAAGHDIEIALDLAFQCSPDHPWVREHPLWFRHRPDGSIAFAENPPKKYEDIYPLDFETPEWESLWDALADVVRHWIGHGVRIFRVDNPHTKPFAFWEWLLAAVRRDHPDVVFLAEAFTRPRPMYRLAKLGFSQSYTYFAWRTTKQELTDYMVELTTTDVAEYFRPSFWVNTPDILIEYLQTGGRAAFAARLVLAATLSANYGVYGPAYESLEATPRERGSEEYERSEKFELRHWDLARTDSLAPLITRLNHIRRLHPALLSNAGLRFHGIDNEQLLVYSKSSTGRDDIVLVVVNLDPKWTQAGWTDLDLEALGIDHGRPFDVLDELDGDRHTWQGPRNFVRLDPAVSSAHLFSLRQGPDPAAGGEKA